MAASTVSDDAALAQQAEYALSTTQDDAPSPATAGPAPPPPSGPTNMDEFLADLNRVPLFMTKLDETDGGSGSNADLDALRSLAYEGTRGQVAQNFREQGNDLARVRRWADARTFYDKALDVIDGKGPAAKEPSRFDAAPGEREVDWLGDGEESKVVDVEEEEARLHEVEEACAVNRALCNLELKNYGQATRDCARALRLNAKNVKAYYRSALALLAIDKTKEAARAAELGLAREPKNASLAAVQAKIAARQVTLETLDTERKARERRVAFEALALKQALKKRGIVTAASGKDKPDMEDAKVALENATDPESELRTPLLMLYPTVGQSELVKEVRESESMGDVLAMVLPVPFEGGEEFGGPDGLAVDVFVESGTGGLKKIGKKVSWGRVLKDGGCVIRDGLCQAYVVPKGKVDGWIHEYKKRAGKG